MPKTAADKEAKNKIEGIKYSPVFVTLNPSCKIFYAVQTICSSTIRAVKFFPFSCTYWYFKNYHYQRRECVRKSCKTKWPLAVKQNRKREELQRQVYNL